MKDEMIINPQYLIKLCKFKRFLCTVMVITVISAMLIGCDNKDIQSEAKADSNQVSELVSQVFGDRAEVSEEMWMITQYGDSSEKQNSFYLITSNKGRVVVVDAGWRENANQVADEINKWGGHVDAWILTHPHPDHIGAFDEVYKQSANAGKAEGIVIDAIYDNGLDMDYYDTVDEEWDEIDVYKEYLEITKEDNNVHHVVVGDKIDIGSLNISFYNAYNENVKSVVDDIGNNASLVFTMSANDRSMLFVGDCYSEAIINHVFATYGSDIDVCMAQMPHHGNSSLPDSYYEQLDLDICFFDAPAWLVEGEGYTTAAHLAAMEGAGSFCLDQSTAPNMVPFYAEDK